MEQGKIKLDCTSCGAPLYNTDNQQIYTCIKCDTSFKVKFDSDGISIVEVEKKIKRILNQLIKDFEEKLNKNTLLVDCTICNYNLEQTHLKNLYYCSACEKYFKVIFNEGNTLLINPEQDLIKDAKDLKEFTDKLYNLRSEAFSYLKMYNKKKENIKAGKVLITFGVIAILLFLLPLILDEIEGGLLTGLFAVVSPMILITGVSIFIFGLLLKGNKKTLDLLNSRVENMENEIKNVESKY